MHVWFDACEFSHVQEGSYVAGRLLDKGDLDGYAVFKRVVKATEACSV